MEFEIQRTEFLEGLRLTQGVVERRNTLPILSNTLDRAGRRRNLDSGNRSRYRCAALLYGEGERIGSHHRKCT